MKPQPSKPATVAEILARRPPLTPTTAPVSGFPTGNSSSLFTVGPPPKCVLTVVSWNIQTFSENKSQANPYVNAVVNSILQALDADICLLLETRENPSVNLAAIEHRLANPSSYKSDEKSEEEWDLTQLEAESVEWLKNVETFSAHPQQFEAVATELTGKRYQPPARIFLYDGSPPNPIWPKMHKGLSLTGKTYNGFWKQVYSQSAVMKRYYVPYRESTDQPVDVHSVALTSKHEADVQFRLQRCAGCGQHLGTSTDCEDCVDTNPFSTSFENLRDELDSVSFRLQGGVELETYGVLVRSDTSYTPTGGFMQLRDKAVNVERWGCQLLRYAPPGPAELLSEDERLKAFAKGANLTLPVDSTTLGAALGDALQKRGQNADDVSVSAHLNELGIPTQTADQPPRPLSLVERVQLFATAAKLGSTDAKDMPGIISNAVTSQGKDPGAVARASMLDVCYIPRYAPHGRPLSYLVPAKNTPYGRSPFVVPLLARLSTTQAERRIPMVGFHAPYGKDDDTGFQIRVAALQEVLNGDVGATDLSPFQSHADAILIGDLNLDLSEPKSNKAGSYAHKAYDALGQAGFEYAIPKVPSSLISVFNNSWKKQKKPTKYDGAKWVNVSGPTSSFTSSAYDNVLVRGADLQNRVVTAAVIDVLDWIKDGIVNGQVDTSAALLEWNGFSSLTPQQKAFFIYRVFVSDHLPIVLDVEVEPLPSDFAQRVEAQRWTRRIQYLTSRVRNLELVYQSTLWMDACPATTVTEWDGMKGALYIGILEDVASDGSLALSLGKDGLNNTIIRTFARPRGGSGEKGKPCAVIYAKASSEFSAYTVVLIPCSGPTEVMQPVDPSTNAVFIIGKVRAISGDGKRFRIVAGQTRCTLAVPDEWPGPPAKDSYVLALLGQCELREVALAQKDRPTK